MLHNAAQVVRGGSIQPKDEFSTGVVLVASEVTTEGSKGWEWRSGSRNARASHYRLTQSRHSAAKMDDISSLISQLREKQGLEQDSQPAATEEDTTVPTLTPEKAADKAPSSKRLRKAFFAWCRDKEGVRAHMQKLRLVERLGKKRRTGNLLVINNVLPSTVAEGALAVLKRVPRPDWQLSSEKEDEGLTEYGAGSTKHRFRAATAVGAEQGASEEVQKGTAALLSIFEEICPNAPSEFQLGRYGHGDHIELHDDAAYSDAVVPGEKNLVLCSRDIAIVFYLTKDWTEEMGGCFVDHACAGGEVIVPQFNSLVAFRVPRPHQVTALKTKRPRYSVFGWVLRPGKLYKLKLDKGSAAHGGDTSTNKPSTKRKHADAERNKVKRVKKDKRNKDMHA